MTFRIGQKVVCIRGYPPMGLATGEIFTVSETRISNFFAFLPRISIFGLGLRVDEIALEPHEWFDATRFRPLVERKTDISIFTSMLNPSKVDA